MAKGYIIATINVTNPEGYKDYTGPTARLVEAHGGRYLVRGGEKTVLEGEMEYDRIVVIEFDSVEKAKAFYEDPEYAEVMKIRQANSESVAVRVAGHDPS